MASVNFSETATPPHIEPTEVYFGPHPSESPILLRIASGGAGQSGLIRALAEGFLESRWADGHLTPFGVAWYASDTTQSFNYLAQNVADLSITYHAVAEQIAMMQGVADRWEYFWRDHWLLVGPKDNPANLSTDPATSIYDQLKTLFIACIRSSTTPRPIRFLSRHDKSACNIKEASLWASIGQTPWSVPYSSWYHQSIDFPFRALEIASLLGEYSITDRGSWFSVEKEVRERLNVFCAGGNEEDDPMLNPAHALLGTKARNKDVASSFLDWIVGEGGQGVIEGFERGGVVLYKRAPGMVLKDEKMPQESVLNDVMEGDA